MSMWDTTSVAIMLVQDSFDIGESACTGMVILLLLICTSTIYNLIAQFVDVLMEWGHWAHRLEFVLLSLFSPS